MNNEKIVELPKKKSKFSVESLRLDPSKQSTEVEKLITRVSVKKPHKQHFIRVRSEEEYRLPVALIRLKDLGEAYLVAPELQDELLEETENVMLYTAINRDGGVFLWPVKLPNEDGKLDAWNESAHKGAEFAHESWVRISANRSLGCYEVLRPKGDLDEPTWPNKNLEELLEIAFEDYYIDSLDHPVIKKLRGIS